MSTQTRFESAAAMLRSVYEHNSVVGNLGEFQLAWFAMKEKWGCRVTQTLGGNETIEYDADPLAAAFRAMQRCYGDRKPELEAPLGRGLTPEELDAIGEAPLPSAHQQEREG